MSKTLSPLLNKLQKPLSRYILVGGITFALELAIIVFAQYLGANSVLAVGISFWFGLAISFVLQKVFSFGDRRVHHTVLIPQLVAYSVLVAFNFLFTIAVTDLLQHTFPIVIVRTIAVGVTTLWNFYLYKTRIFNQPVVD